MPTPSIIFLAPTSSLPINANNNYEDNIVALNTLDNGDSLPSVNTDVAIDVSNVVNANVVKFGSSVDETGNVIGMVVVDTQLNDILPVGVPVCAGDISAPSIEALSLGDNMICDNAIKVTNNCLSGPGKESVPPEEDFLPLPSSGGGVVARESSNCLHNYVEGILVGDKELCDVNMRVVNIDSSELDPSNASPVMHTNLVVLTPSMGVGVY